MIRADRFTHWARGLRLKPGGGETCVRAVVAPHAAFRFCGNVAATAYEKLVGRSYDRVFVVGPSHHAPVAEGYAVDAHHAAYGTTPVDASVRGGGAVPQTVWVGEHSVELQVHALRAALAPGWRLVPVLCGSDVAAPLLRFLATNVGPRDLLVVSVDLTHQDRSAADMDTMRAIEGYDHWAAETADCDAPMALSALIQLAVAHSWLVEPCGYARPNGVGYHAAAYHGPPVTELEMQNGFGCFVTLSAANRELRGCRGDQQRGPLAACRKRNRTAAENDSRFAPVRRDERVTETVSVLSRMVALPRAADYARRAVPGLHGVVFALSGGRSALFLPSVWRSFEHPAEFFEALAKKAGGELADVTGVWLFTAREH